MQSLQLANDERNNIIHFNIAEVTAKQEEKEEVDKECPDSTSENVLSVHETLKNILKDIRKAPRVPSVHTFPINVKPRLDLLEKLVERSKLNMVVLTLYPMAHGYTIALRASDGTIVSESQQEYIHDEFFEYINNEELPPNMAIDWEQVFPEVFYRGCVIVEIVDCRLTIDKAPIHHILLKPHSESIMNDVMYLLMEKDVSWTKEEKHSVERSLVNSMQPPLCLDPNPNIGYRRISQYNRQNMFNTEDLNVVVARETEKNYSMMDALSANDPSFGLFEFIKHKVKQRVPADGAKTKNTEDPDCQVKNYPNNVDKSLDVDTLKNMESCKTNSQEAGHSLNDGTHNGVNEHETFFSATVVEAVAAAAAASMKKIEMAPKILPQTKLRQVVPNNFNNNLIRIPLPTPNQLSSSSNSSGAQQENNLTRNSTVPNIHQALSLQTFTPHFQTLRTNNIKQLKSTNTRHFPASPSLPNVPANNTFDLWSQGESF